jgi:peptidoglycan/LPS O-acetylase OafA/YrhL
VTSPTVASVEQASTDAHPDRAEAPARAQGRVPALDGIRGIAILGVLLFHFRQLGFPRFLAPLGDFATNWGWTGVELFFVLSGYLITGILCDAKGSPNYFRSFYWRRALRIFPPYFLLLAVLFVVLPLVAPELTPRLDLRRSSPQWIYWTYLSDFAVPLHVKDYDPLLHTWSLAVEEKFYLLWPALVLWMRRERLIQLCGAVVIASLVARLALLWAGYPIRFVHDPALLRSDSLLLGALVALLARSPAAWPAVRRYAWLCAAITLGAGLAIFFAPRVVSWLSRNTEMSIRYSWISLFYACVLVVSVAAPSSALLNRALGNVVLRFFGRYSYGLYLYHWPLLMVIRSKAVMRNPRDTNGMVLRWCVWPLVTILVALLSWHLLEKHVLKLKRLFPMRPIPENT